MASPNSYFVDPVGGNDTTGDGSIGTPWASVQKALDTADLATTDTTGAQINVKSGGADTLTAALDVDGTGKYGNPTVDAPLIIRGYDLVENDGGIGEIDGNNTYGIINDNVVDNITFIDMKMGNCGSAQILDLDRYITIIRCELYGSSAGIGVEMTNYNTVIDCYIHSCTGANAAIRPGGYGLIDSCFVDCGTANTEGIRTAAGLICINNIVKVNNASATGIHGAGSLNHIIGNSVYAGSSGAAYGIEISPSGTFLNVVYNNVIEGTTDPIAATDVSSDPIAVIKSNFLYNNTNPIDVGTDTPFLNEDNVNLTASPFIDPDNNDFRVTSELREKGFPQVFRGAPLSANYLDAGACQRKEPLISALQNARLG